MCNLTTTFARCWLRPALLIFLGLTLAGQFPANAQEPKETPGLAGTWTWTWKDGLGQTHRHVLEVEGVDPKYAARELFDDQPAVRVANLVVNGPVLKFSVTRASRKAEYDGKVAKADTINGTVKITGEDGNIQEFPWNAERRKDIPK